MDFILGKKTADQKYLLYLSFGDPILNNGNKLQSVEVDLSQNIVNFGKISRVSGALTKTNWKMTPLNIPSLSTGAGNPASSATDSANGYLFWDDESLPTGQRDLFFATESSSGVFGTKQTLAVSQAGVDEYQPYFFQNRIYYSLAHGAIVSQVLAVGADPAVSGSWSQYQTELEVDAAQISVPGGISVIGEPSLYQDSSGKKWLYFAYSVRSPDGLNLNIGRVRSK